MEDAVPPSAWGPQLWRAIHLVALGCPATLDARTADAYRSFFAGLADVIPCPTCAANYRRHLLELPVEPYLTEGRGDRLFEWTVRLHNLVNAELQRPGSRPDWTPDQARDALLRHIGVRGGGGRSSSGYTGPMSDALQRMAASPALVVFFFCLGAAAALGVLAVARRLGRRRR